MFLKSIPKEHDLELETTRATLLDSIDILIVHPVYFAAIFYQSLMLELGKMRSLLSGQDGAGDVCKQLFFFILEEFVTPTGKPHKAWGHYARNSLSKQLRVVEPSTLGLDFSYCLTELIAFGR